MTATPFSGSVRVQIAARFTFVVAAVFAFVMASLPHPPRFPGDPPDKLLHILAFATLGILAALGFRTRSVLYLLAALTIFGGVIEIVQAIPALNRDSELVDWLADIAASFAALALTRLLARRLSW